MLLICRYSGTLGVAADYFDAANVYIIPIEKVRLNVDEHEDYEQEFIVQSPKKSSAFVAKTKRERDQWVKRISEAIRTAKESRIERKKYSKMGHELEGLQPAAGKRSNISKGCHPKEEGKPVECEGEEEEEDEMGKHSEINCNGKAKEMKVGKGINNNHRHSSNNAQQNSLPPSSLMFQKYLFHLFSCQLIHNYRIAAKRYDGHFYPSKALETSNFANLDSG
jgi:hypothetical protein